MPRQVFLWFLVLCMCAWAKLCGRAVILRDYWAISLWKGLAGYVDTFVQMGNAVAGLFSTMGRSFFFMKVSSPTIH